MSRSSRSRAIVVCGALWLACAALAAAAELDDGRNLTEGRHRLEHVTCAAAVGEVEELLTPRGSVELLEGGRTVVVRDTEAVVNRALDRLAALDRPGRSVRVAVQIVSAEAGGRPALAETPVELPVEVVERLADLLRYRGYALLARAELEAREEATATYEVGSDYQVRFRLHREGEARRVSMREFRVLRKTAEGELKPLVQTDLHLEVGRPMILGLTQTESSERALMLVLECDETLTASSEARG